MPKICYLCFLFLFEIVLLQLKNFFFLSQLSVFSFFDSSWFCFRTVASVSCNLVPSQSIYTIIHLDFYTFANLLPMFSFFLSAQHSNQVWGFFPPAFTLVLPYFLVFANRFCLAILYFFFFAFNAFCSVLYLCFPDKHSVPWC